MSATIEVCDLRQETLAADNRRWYYQEQLKWVYHAAELGLPLERVVECYEEVYHRTRIKLEQLQQARVTALDLLEIEGQATPKKLEGKPLADVAVVLKADFPEFAAMCQMNGVEDEATTLGALTNLVTRKLHDFKPSYDQCWFETLSQVFAEKTQEAA